MAGNLFGSSKSEQVKYAGRDSYGDPDVVSTGLAEDLKAIGLKGISEDLKTLIGVWATKGKPVDDKKMTMEKLIAITASLPETSATRHKLSSTIVDTLWDSLQHPPLSYHGDKFQYRTPDGSYNNVLQPDLGKAGTPYAKTVRSAKKMHGVRPDPGLLFDLLMAREEGGFKENPAGISSVLFYHATIIIHDIFRTNRFDTNISDTSSYLDLAPLYGSSLEDQLKIRTLKGGLLKPDTFHEKRLLSQPVGVNVLLVLYSRFHNYVADILLKINENGRFTLPPTIDEEAKKKAEAKQDNDIFQTARLIVGGLYVNISLHDYLRGLTNTHHSKSSWTLDPRIDIGKEYDGQGVPRGIGNQVSSEFNLLYRFHSTISQRDEKWMNEFFKSLFPNVDKPINELNPQELAQGLLRYEQSIDEDPSKREFGGLKRGPDGKFSDKDLVDVLQASIEDPAGAFGARNVPKALRVVEILGIVQSRKWHTATLNEFRAFFDLKPHDTFEDINADPEVADILRNLYDHPDMVELYPGLFVEEAKLRMDPGCGGCPPYTVGRAVFSDAVALVRSDRFYTLDYTTATLTNWGLAEVKQDYKTLGGSMLYKLIQRGVPGWFPFNSLHVMQPMFTRKMNETIAREIGQIDLYTLDPPKPPRKPVILTNHSLIKQVLKDRRCFVTVLGPGLNQIFPGKEDYTTYMLGGDKLANTSQRNLVGDILYGPADFKALLSDFVFKSATAYLKENLFTLGKTIQQIDIIRDLAIPVNARVLADIFSLDLNGEENPKGVHNEAEIYRYLLDIRVWGFVNNDPALAWNRRRWATEAATKLSESTQKVVSKIQIERLPKGILDKLQSILPWQGDGAKTKQGSLRWYGSYVASELLSAGKSVKEVSDILWLTAVGGVAVVVSLFAEVLQYFLLDASKELWSKIQELAKANNDESDKILKLYVLEAQRLTTSQRNLRVVAESITIDGQTFNKGDAVVCLFGPACKDPKLFPDPQKFNVDRPVENYIHFGYGPHECLGREIALTTVTILLKVVAGLKNLRPAPGTMGLLKSLFIGNERSYLTSDWSELTFDPTTWKLHCDGFGSGVAPTAKKDPSDTKDINTILLSLKKIAAETESGSGSSKGSTSNSNANANVPPKAADK